MLAAISIDAPIMVLSRALITLDENIHRHRTTCGRVCFCWHSQHGLRSLLQCLLPLSFPGAWKHHWADRSLRRSEQSSPEMNGHGGKNSRPLPPPHRRKTRHLPEIKREARPLPGVPSLIKREIVSSPLPASFFSASMDEIRSHVPHLSGPGWRARVESQSARITPMLEQVFGPNLSERPDIGHSPGPSGDGEPASFYRSFSCHLCWQAAREQ